MESVAWGRREELVERDAERAAIDAALSEAAAGDGAVVAVAGAPGCGRSSLLRLVRHRARERGTTTLCASGSPPERTFRFGVARQLLEAAAGPGLAGPSDRTADDDDDAVPHAVLDTLFRATARLASSNPLVLTVDDLQWADEASLRFLEYLTGRLEGLPILLAIAPWPTGREPEGGRMSHLGSSSAARVLDPAPLSPGATAGLAAAALGAECDAAFGHACHAATGGVPFLVRGLLRDAARLDLRPAADDVPALDALAPDAIARAVQARLSARPAPVTALLRSVAVLGDGAELRDAAEVAALDHAAASGAAAALVEDDVLEQGNPLRFRHPVVRRAVYRAMPRDSCSGAHRRAARVLAVAPTADDCAVAAHLLATEPEDDAWVARTLTAAAARTGDPRTAAALLRRALDEPPPASDRPHVVGALGRAELLTGECSAEQNLAAAWEQVTGRPAAVGVDLGLALARNERCDEAMDVLDAVADRHGGDPVDLARLAVTGWRRGGRERLRSLADQAEARGGTPVRAAVRARRALDDLLRSPVPARCGSVDTVRELLRGGSLLGHVGGDYLHGTLAWSLVLLGDPRTAERELDSALEHALRGGGTVNVAQIRWLRAAVRLRTGRLAAVEQDIGPAMDTALRSWPLGAPAVAATAVEMLVERNRPDEAVALLERLGADDGTLPDEPRFLGLSYARGRLRYAQDRFDEAGADLADHGRRLADEGIEAPLTPWRCWSALVSWRLGRVAHAAGLVDEELATARASGSPEVLGAALRTAGRLDASPERALALLAEAEEAVGTTDDDLERARTALDHGAALARAGQRSRARDRVLAGFELATRCGATALAAQARSALQGLGVRSCGIAGVAAGLTSCEYRIAELAAEGHGNREIARQLFVTTKTIEWHLTHVYRKLGIRSRTALHGVLERPVA